MLLCFACVEMLCALELLHWRDAWTCWTLGIPRKPRTKASFHIFNCWNSKEASHESFVFMNHRCDLNVRIWTKHCVFSGLNGGSVVEKSWFARDGLRRRRFGFDSCSFCARSGTIMVPGDFFFSLMMLCYCFACVETLCAMELVHWRDAFTSWPLGIWRKSRTKASFSPLQLLEFEGSLAPKIWDKSSEVPERWWRSVAAPIGKTCFWILQRYTS